jgi:hypothetical protein
VYQRHVDAAHNADMAGDKHNGDSHSGRGEVERLLEAAEQATRHLPRAQRITTRSGLAGALGASPQMVTNWNERGVPADWCIKAQTLWGVSPSWVKFGKAPSVFSRDPHEPGNTPAPRVGDVEPVRYKVSPPTVTWATLLQPLPAPEFETVIDDQSMAPELPQGTRAIFSTELQPSPGDWALLAVDNAAVYVREYRIAQPGSWVAHALNPAFPSFDSRQSNLRVLAVFDGMRGRRARA